MSVGSGSSPLSVSSLNPNNDLSQISRYSINGLLVRDVMRIETMITQFKFSFL